MGGRGAARRRYVDGPHGQVHVAEAGAGNDRPVLLLHQTPRSWREFAFVLPLLADRGYRPVAMDTPGMGASDAPEGAPSIEAYAEAAVAVLAGVADGPAAVVGHHTGGAIALEAAARAPERVAALVLSSTPWVDAERRERVAASRPPIDAVEERDDGGHLTQLWQRRQGFYPEGRPDLLHAYVTDALRVGVGEEVEAGHRALNAYRMEDRVGLLRAPTLVLGATEDPYAWSERDRLAEVLRAQGLAVETSTIEGGMVPLPDQLPNAFADAVARHLDRTWPA